MAKQERVDGPTDTQNSFHSALPSSRILPPRAGSGGSAPQPRGLVSELQELQAFELREIIVSICLEPPADIANNRNVALDLIRIIKQRRPTTEFFGESVEPAYRQAAAGSRSAPSQMERVARSLAGLDLQSDPNQDLENTQTGPRPMRTNPGAALLLREGYARCSKCKCVFAEECNNHIDCNYHPGTFFDPRSHPDFILHPFVPLVLFLL